jgi:UDP-3-O-[3-hydroxymyristoyl] glucosamine N-acyltransferase
VQAITGADIAAFLGRPLQGASLPVRKPADLAACGDGDLAWVLSYTSERLEHLEQRRPALAIVDPQTAGLTTVPHICCENPRLAFSQVLQAFFIAEPPPEIHSTALVHPQAVIGQRVSIGPYARIGPGVTVGDDSVIGSGVSIEGEVVLGMRCRVKANSVIGAPGFGFAYDEDGVPVHFPHIGNVVFEDDVWVGACSTVECGALSSTRLCHGVKVDDLVQIGHNVRVGANTLVTANTVLCGRVVVGEGCWIAPNSVVKEGVRIGDGAKVGMGAVVLRDVEPGTVVAGVPAKPLEKKC